jgi:hypothetical protein
MTHGPVLTAATPHPASPDVRLLARMIAFLAFLVTVELWLTHHLDLGRGTPWVAMVFAVTSGLGWVLDKGQMEGLTAWIRGRLHRWLGLKAVVLLWAVALAPLLLLSSVALIPDPGMPDSSVRVASVDRQPQCAKRVAGVAPVRCLVPTSPFGRTFRVAVDGYVEQAVTVYPGAGARLSPDRDLRRSPAVLLRPPVYALRYLDGGGYLTVRAASGGGAGPLVERAGGHRGAFLIGRNQAIPGGSARAWKLDLEGDGHAPNVVAQTLRDWSRPRFVALEQPLAPGMTVVAEIRTGSAGGRPDRVVARTEVALGSESFIDVGMLAVEEL